MSSRAPGHHGYQARVKPAPVRSYSGHKRITSLPVARSRTGRRADRASEPAHLREIIRDGSSVRHQTKGNNLRCHNDLAWGEGKGRREYAYTPERPSAVFLLGCTHHRNGDRGCEPPHLSVVSECRARMDASSVYRAQKPRHGRPMAGFLLLTFAPASVGKRAAR